MPATESMLQTRGLFRHCFEVLQMFVLLLKIVVQVYMLQHKALPTLSVARKCSEKCMNHMNLMLLCQVPPEFLCDENSVWATTRTTTVLAQAAQVCMLKVPK
jgi:hypothetical protein